MTDSAPFLKSKSVPPSTPNPMPDLHVYTDHINAYVVARSKTEALLLVEEQGIWPNADDFWQVPDDASLSFWTDKETGSPRQDLRRIGRNVTKTASAWTERGAGILTLYKSVIRPAEAK
jgi:hypothetical protein